MLPTAEVLPLGQRRRRGDVACCVGSWSQGGVNGQSALDDARNKIKGINAVKPVSSFFSVPSSILCEALELSMIQRGPTTCVFGDAVLAPLWDLQMQSMRSSVRRDVPEQMCG